MSIASKKSVGEEYSKSPTKYESSSTMSPDRREFYLGHKSGSRVVVEIGDSTILTITGDPRFPLDRVCVHTDNEAIKMLVIYSSKMINVAKVANQESLSTSASELARQAQSALKSSTTRVLPDVLSKLPRRKSLRTREGYNRIPLDKTTGALNLTSNVYPVSTPLSGDDLKFSLATEDWYVWLSILADFDSNKIALFTVGNDSYIAIGNTYNIVIQKL